MKFNKIILSLAAALTLAISTIEAATINRPNRPNNRPNAVVKPTTTRPSCGCGR